MKIAVDAFGGDYAPAEIIKGCVEALKADSELSLLICGSESIIKEELNKYKINDFSRIEILDAREVITNHDVPTQAIREKKDSSLVKGLKRLKEDDEIKAFVSAGSTGAFLTGALLIAGRLDGIDRPALAPLLPTMDKKNVMLIDSGANMDCKPEYLLQFAVMGTAYMQAMYGIKSPRVALMSVGTEDSKGNEQTKEAFKLLADSKLNFVGNMEARDLLSGNYDVVVCDGFVGNVTLKTLEGSIYMVFGALKESIASSFKAKMGALLMKPALKQLKNRLDYTKVGGAPFLGCKKIVIKTHGSSKAVTVKAAILQAHTLAKNNLIEKIQSGISELSSNEQ